VARIKFTGPAGSKFEGLDLVMVRPGKARIKDLAEIQKATGLKMADLQSTLTENEALGIQAVIFMSLRAAGQFVSFDEAGDFAEDEFDIVVEPGDLPEEEPDPTSARTDSAPGDEPPASKGPSKRKNPGSKSRSSDAS
jgi:hypothetical protein